VRVRTCAHARSVPYMPSLHKSFHKVLTTGLMFANLQGCMFALSTGMTITSPEVLFSFDVSHLVREMHPTLPVEMMVKRW